MIKKLFKLLLWLLLLPVFLILLLVVTGPWEFDLSGQRERIGGLLQDHLGWEMQVEQGPVLTLSGQLGLSAGGLRLANPAWTEAPELIRAERIEVAVDLWPLFFRRLEAAAGRLSGGEVRLHWDAAGRSNWQPATGEGAAKPARGSGLDWQLPDSWDVQVEDSSVDYRHLRDGTSYDLTIRTARVEGASGAVEVAVALDADVDGNPLTLQGRIGRFRDLITGSRPYPVDLSLNLLGVQGKAKGVLVNPLTGADADLKVELNADSMAGFRPWLGKYTERLEPLQAELRVHGSGQTYSAELLRLDLGDASVRGDLGLDLAGERPRVKASVKSRDLDLTPWLARRRSEAGEPPAREVPAEADPAKSAPAPKLFSAQPLPWDSLRALDAQVLVEVERLRTHGVEVAELRLELELEQGRLQTKLNGVVQGDRDYSLTAVVDGRSSTPELTLNLDGDNLRLANLAEFTAAHGLVEGELELLVDLKGRGRSPSAIMASLDGKALALVEDGRADVRRLDNLVGGAGALLGQLVTAKDQLARVNCSVNGVLFERGQGKVQALLDTDYSVVVGTGTLDLVEERVDLRVVPKPKGVTLSVAAPVLVKGPLSAPAFELEPTGILIKLTDLVAKAALPHLILVEAFGDAVSDSACGALMAGTSAEEPKKPAASGSVGAVAAGADSVVKGTRGVIQSTGDTVRGLFGTPNKDDPETAPAPPSEPAPKDGSLFPH